MNKLRIGTGGYPLTTPSNNFESALTRLNELGLEHLELEFVQSVYVKPEQAAVTKQAAKSHDISLSVHGSYFVNLASLEGDKWHASINRVIDAATRGDECGAVSVTYHSGFLQKQTNEQVYPRIREGMVKVLKEVQSRGLKIRISPEVTGKPAQFGDIDTLSALIADLKNDGYADNVGICIDFAHQYARSNGQFNTYDEFMQMLEMTRSRLGDDQMTRLHMHISAIEYSDKGEKNHLLLLDHIDEYKANGVDIPEIMEHHALLRENRLQKNRFNWRDLLKALKASNVGGYVVCESPLLELDAKLMKLTYESL